MQYLYHISKTVYSYVSALFVLILLTPPRLLCLLILLPSPSSSSSLPSFSSSSNISTSVAGYCAQSLPPPAHVTCVCYSVVPVTEIQWLPYYTNTVISPQSNIVHVIIVFKRRVRFLSTPFQPICFL